MLEAVYIVPGLAESALATIPTGGGAGQLVYPDIPGFLFGTFGSMRLAPDGINPGPPDGVALMPSGVLTPWVGNPTAQLFGQAERAGFNLTNWPWDWRKSILTAGDSLAAQIVENVSTGQQCSIVGHSAGGLVARRAWSTLSATGQQGLIRRIITLGTPHYGSYSIVNAWSGGESFLLTMWQWNRWALQTIPGILQQPDWVSWRLDQVLGLSMTWPGLYEVLPLPNAPDSVSDPNRLDLYTANNWGGLIAPQQTWLDHTRTTYQNWALSPTSMPPQNIMICVAGGYRGTASGLIYPGLLGTPQAIGSTDDGDDTVTRSSAQLVGAVAYRVTPDHASLYPNSCQNGDLLDWLTVSLSPTPPPPPEDLDTTPISIALSDPPPGPAAPKPSPDFAPAADC